MARPNVIRMDEHRPANPQLEDGYVRIANELFDAVLAKLASYRHIKVVLAIIRKTYGYQKKEDDITISQLAEITGIHRNHVGATLRELGAMRVVNPLRAGLHGMMVGINKRHTEWATGEVKPRGAANPAAAATGEPATNLVDATGGNQNSCTTQPKQLHDATKTVDVSNQNVAHKRQPQKTTPKDNPNKAQSRDCAARFDRFWQAFGHKKGRVKAEEAFGRLMADSDDADALLDRIVQAAAKEAERRPHLVADGRTPMHAQGWLSQRRFEDEDLAQWGRYTEAQQAFVEAFNANVGDVCPAIDEWTEKRAALIDIALGGKWSTEKWGEFWRYVRDDCEFRWPVSLEWMLDRENFAKVRSGQYARGEA